MDKLGLVHKKCQKPINIIANIPKTKRIWSWFGFAKWQTDLIALLGLDMID